MSRLSRVRSSVHKASNFGCWHQSNQSLSTSKMLHMKPETQQLFEGLVKGQRQALARAITLVESSNPSKLEEAKELVVKVEERLQQAARHTTSKTFRIGLTGPPGAGKSTFIEAFGLSLTAQGHKVAVLAVDPSSGTTGGSLLGDKTRMTLLTRDPNAFIRPSPSKCHLGGVTRTTNEAIVLCEGAGYDIIIVETVGVGQSEYLVADMVDIFCLVIPPAGGDELQGLKRGIIEQCDLILVNKSDGDLLPAARRIKAEYTSALKFLRRKTEVWKPKVKMVSSLTQEGLDDAWNVMNNFKSTMVDSNIFIARRNEQRKKWMWNYVQFRLNEMFSQHPSVKRRSKDLEKAVARQETSPGAAADELIQEFFNHRR